MRTRITKTGIRIVFTIIAFVSFTFSGCNKGEKPEIMMITPTTGGVHTEITIEGLNFEPGASVLIDDIESTFVELSGDIIYARIPSGVIVNTPLDVTVVNPGGASSTLDEAFTAILPELDFVNSASKPSGIVGSTVILEGNAFGSIEGTSKIVFSDGAGGSIEATVVSADDWTDEFIITTVPTGAGNGPLYIETELGKSNEIEFMLAQAATFSPSTINWSLTASLPAGISGHNANFMRIEDESSAEIKQFVYVTGGMDNTAQASAQTIYGEIDVSGSIPEWTVGTNSLPSGIAFHQAIAATPFNSRVKGNGYLYALGGVDDNGNALSSIFITKINNDGSPGPWETSVQNLPQDIHSFGAVLFRSAVYIAGGAMSDNTPVTKVYKSEIDTLGVLGSWQEMADLPVALSHHGFLNFGAYLYVVGGETSAMDPGANSSTGNSSEVYYARLDLRSGDINEEGWMLNANQMQKSRSKHITLIAGGNMFVSSGIYAAAAQGSSENTYAQVNADGSVESFNGATGSNTLQSEGGANLYNSAGISYVDSDGVAHVMIIGGDNINSQGTKSSNVLYY